MSIRNLVEPECAGANPLMRLGTNLMRSSTYKDEGITGRAGTSFTNRQQQFEEESMVNEFLGQISVPPQTFRMDALLQEMREIDAQNFNLSQVQRAPPVMEEVNAGTVWANEFAVRGPPPNAEDFLKGDMEQIWHNNILEQAENEVGNEQPIVLPQYHQGQEHVAWSRQFFDVNEENKIPEAAGEVLKAVSDDSDQIKYSEFLKFIKNVNEGDVKINDGQVTESSWADEFAKPVSSNSEDWVSDFNKNKGVEVEAQENYNTQFWTRLEDEWKKISQSDDSKHPWLSEFSDFYDPYKEYTFDENNPMMKVENAFEKGKIFLSQGDIPSAVLCFESAAKQDPNNFEIWELLGTSQAENEKDPNAIAALKRSLHLNPNNPKVLMALAISYTNESLQSHALKTLIKWLNSNESYQTFVPPELLHRGDDDVMPGSVIHSPDLKDVQQLFLNVVRQNPAVIDPDIQQALGVLFNLSSEYDKAVDCFKAALNIVPQNAKVWNRLGASLANGNRSVEAVDAYQRALDIEPGYIRARYNVGIVCINLKAYREAAEHFLTALNHQATSVGRSGVDQLSESNNQMSDTIWSTLRMAISLMGRVDLQSSIDNRDLSALNKAFDHHRD